MNGSTDVRSNSTTANNPTRTTKTDTPLPLDTPAQEVAGTTPREHAGGNGAAHGERMISGIDLLDYGAGGLMPHKVYLIKGGTGVGKSLLGLQYLTRGLELQEPGVLITDQKPENVLAQAHSIGFAIEDLKSRNGTWLNGARTFHALLHNADMIRIGATELRYEILYDGAAQPTTT